MRRRCGTIVSSEFQSSRVPEWVVFLLGEVEPRPPALRISGRAEAVRQTATAFIPRCTPQLMWRDEIPPGLRDLAETLLLNFRLRAQRTRFDLSLTRSGREW